MCEQEVRSYLYVSLCVWKKEQVTEESTGSCMCSTGEKVSAGGVSVYTCVNICLRAFFFFFLICRTNFCKQNKFTVV